MFIYPTTLIPDFVTDLDLPDFGVEIQEVYGAEIRTFGTFSGIGTKMSFKYENRSAEELKTLVDFYRSVYGKFHSFDIPKQLWRHPDGLTDSISQLLRLNSWRFDDQINFTTVRADVYNFQAKFKSVTQLNTNTNLGEFFPCRITQ